jgi:hypothetical protein
MVAQPKLGFWSRGAERLREGFLCNRPGSLDRRVRHDVADRNDADGRDCEYNDHSDGELRDAASHGQSPIIGCGT